MEEIKNIMEKFNENILMSIVCKGNIALDFNGINDFVEFTSFGKLNVNAKTIQICKPEIIIKTN